MRHFVFSFIFISASIMAICSCDGKAGGSRTGADSISFDSIKVDTTLSLTEDTAGPRCHVKLCLTYAKGKNADFINDSLLRSGILSPDFLSITDKHISVDEAVDSFVTKYLSDYKAFYGELYRADKSNSTSYNCEYILSSGVSQDNADYYTYQANVYSYMGGAHGSSITVVRNIDVKTGKIVTLRDLFVPGYERSLGEEIVKTLCDEHGAKDLKSLSAKTTIFDGIDVYASDNFIIGKKSMTFIYSPDEIASHVTGEVRVKVDNGDIENILRK